MIEALCVQRLAISTTRPKSSEVSAFMMSVPLFDIFRNFFTSLSALEELLIIFFVALFYKF
jgi:hypothetical protein